VIKSFADEHTRRFWESGKSAKWPPANLRDVARRKLQMLDAGAKLDDLRMPPGNRLHALTGDRDGQHAIRINDQFRICFRWHENDAYEVEVTDYH
jgi:proteic killer suppression protein